MSNVNESFVLVVGDDRRFGMDFTDFPELEAGDTLASIGTVYTIPASTGITIGATSVASPIGYVRLSATEAAAEREYVLYMPVTTTAGYTIVGDKPLVVRTSA